MVVDRNEVNAADARGGGFGGRRKPGRVRESGDGGCSEAEPVLARELHLTELVADHELLHLGQRREVDDRFDVPAIAGVRRNPTRRRVRVVEEAGELELGEHVADGRAGHAEPVPIDERLTPDRRGGGDVFLDDGPEDRLCAEVQGADGATDPTRQGRVSRLLFGRLALSMPEC